MPKYGIAIDQGTTSTGSFLLLSTGTPPRWPMAARRVEPTGSPDYFARVRENYRTVLDRAHPLLTEGGP
jgi:hypothetical protein